MPTERKHERLQRGNGNRENVVLPFGLSAAADSALTIGTFAPTYRNLGAKPTCRLGHGKDKCDVASGAPDAEESYC